MKKIVVNFRTIFLTSPQTFYNLLSAQNENITKGLCDKDKKDFVN